MYSFIYHKASARVESLRAFEAGGTVYSTQSRWRPVVAALRVCWMGLANHIGSPLIAFARVVSIVAMPEFHAMTVFFVV